jgi:hypothetical protein
MATSSGCFKTDDRARAPRRRDTEHRLTHDIDVWVAGASADRTHRLVWLSPEPFGRAEPYPRPMIEGAVEVLDMTCGRSTRSGR